jgi:hypothetical protein
MVKIIFHTVQIDVRGTCTAIYDYAHYNEILLGNKSVILTSKNNKNNDIIAVEKFEKRFKVLYYDKVEDIEEIVKDYDIIYNIKYGTNDNFLFKNIKNIVHSVFDMSEEHGDIFAGVSEALVIKFGKNLFVPHMIGLRPSETKENLREKLNIPKKAIVFGRHGGADTFDISFAKTTISKIVRDFPTIYFIFVNTPCFDVHPQIIYLDKIIDDEDKNMFINTCDACIHAQTLGETFGLSIGEFSVNNKPIFTYGGYCWNNSHKLILKDKAIYYHNNKELYFKIVTFDKDKYENMDLNCYKEYSPENVMQKFKEVFID